MFKFRAYDGRVSQGLTVSRAVAKLHVAALINPQGPNFENGYKLACFFSCPLYYLIPLAIYLTKLKYIKIHFQSHYR